MFGAVVRAGAVGTSIAAAALGVTGKAGAQTVDSVSATTIVCATHVDARGRATTDCIGQTDTITVITGAPAQSPADKFKMNFVCDWPAAARPVNDGTCPGTAPAGKIKAEAPANGG